jgi:hypothetical protein
MSETTELLKAQAPKAAPSWVELANREIAELQAAAAVDPKTFYGNRQRGMGEGLARVGALLRTVKGLEQALNGIDRGL